MAGNFFYMCDLARDFYTIRMSKLMYKNCLSIKKHYVFQCWDFLSFYISFGITRILEYIYFLEMMDGQKNSGLYKL